MTFQNDFRYDRFDFGIDGKINLRSMGSVRLIACVCTQVEMGCSPVHSVLMVSPYLYLLKNASTLSNLVK